MRLINYFFTPFPKKFQSAQCWSHAHPMRCSQYNSLPPRKNPSGYSEFFFVQDSFVFHTRATMDTYLGITPDWPSPIVSPKLIEVGMQITHLDISRASCVNACEGSIQALGKNSTPVPNRFWQGKHIRILRTKLPDLFCNTINFLCFASHRCCMNRNEAFSL